jgi:hypothetical protein
MISYEINLNQKPIQNVSFLLFFLPDLEPAYGRVKNTNHASLTSEERGR